MLFFDCALQEFARPVVWGEGRGVMLLDCALQEYGLSWGGRGGASCS